MPEPPATRAPSAPRSFGSPAHAAAPAAPPTELATPTRSAAVAALAFLFVGVAWIVFSDRLLLALAPTSEAFARLQTWKGTFFVLAVAALLFVLLRTQFARQRREALRLMAAGERLRAQIENSPLALVELDAEGRIARWSPRASELFGWTEAEVLGKSLDDFSFVHPDDREELDRVLENTLADGGAGSIHFNRNLRKDGSIVFCEWYNSWLRDGSGRAAAVISLAQDVTWQREAVEEVRRLNRELEARVHRRTEELAAANADLKAFTWSISHDLRAPVRAVIGFGEILERRHAARLADEGRAYLGHIVEAGHQMDRLIDGLLRYARIDHDTVSPERIDVADMIERLLPRFDAMISETGGTVQIGPDLPILTCDRQLLESVLQNLIDNGLRYRHPERPPLVRVDGRIVSGRPELRVADNGLGIDPADRERVFGLFERVRPSAERPGSGLGLAIVKRALERIDAEIEVADGDGGTGTTFVIRFPGPGGIAA